MKWSKTSDLVVRIGDMKQVKVEEQPAPNARERLMVRFRFRFLWRTRPPSYFRRDSPGNKRVLGSLSQGILFKVLIVLLFGLAFYTLSDIVAAIQEISSNHDSALNLPKPWELLFSLTSLAVLICLRILLCKTVYRPIGALLIPRVRAIE
jgi:hypothetical protein